MSHFLSTSVPQPRASVIQMKEYHPPLGGRNGLRLDFNENTVECSPEVLRVLREIGSGHLTTYPERQPVEKMVAEHLGVAPDQVLLTNGVDEAIHLLCQTYLDTGDECLLPVPTYSMYEVYASSTEARIVRVQAGEAFEFPVERLLAAITPLTKIIAIANPNSPTGSVVTREQIVKILEHAPRAAVLIDEAYFHFYGETVVDLIRDFPNLLVARTFSKAYGMAGLRIGILISQAQSMQWLRRVSSPYSVNSIALACLPAAMQDQSHLDWYVAEVLAARAEFTLALGALKVQWWPSEANFVLAKIGAKHAAFSTAMKGRGVLVRDRSGDPGCVGCVRITIGTQSQMAVAVRSTIETLEEISWSPDCQAGAKDK